MPQTKPTSEQVTFLASGTGASQRTVLAKLRDVVSVKDFGAVGDGVADDTAAINAAVASLGVLGGSILFPSGTYRLASTTSLASRQTHIPISGKSNICFSGYGATLVSEYSAATLNDTGVLFGIQSSQNIIVEGFRIVTEFARTIGSSTATDYGCWAVGIYSSTAQSINVTARNLFIPNAFAVLGIFPTGFRTQNVVVENCSIDLAYYGINCQANGDNVRVENFRTKYVRRSYFVYGVTNHVVNYTNTGQDVDTHDCLISASEGEVTKDISVRASIENSVSTDSLVALNSFATTATPTYGILRNINLNINDLLSTASSYSVTLYNYFDSVSQSGSIAQTCFDNIVISGNIRNDVVMNATQSPRGLMNLDELRIGTTATVVDSGVWAKGFYNGTDEVGTWTPTVSFGNASVGITYTTQLGKYIKRGRMVTVFAEVLLSSKGSSTGVAAIANLPFVGISSTYVPSTIIGFSGMVGLAGTTVGYVDANNPKILLGVQAATGMTALTDTSFSNTSRLFVSSTYQTTN